VLAGLACSPTSGKKASPPAEPQAPPAAAASAASTPTSQPIEAILDQWSAGQREEAIQALLALYDSQAAEVCYRPCSMSEQEFVAQWGEKGAVWGEAFRQKLAAQLGVLRQIARELERRAKEAAAAGDLAAATRLLETLKRVGAANRAPGLVLIAGLVGEKLEEVADAGLAELNKPAAEPPAAPP
jgi:hypothetical protein